MTDRVLGPGGRGVVVVSDDPGEARAEVWRLRAADIPATTPGDAGLRTPVEHGSVLDAVRFWSTATRRTAVAADRGERWIARPGGEPIPAGPMELPDEPRDDPSPRVAVFGGAWVREDHPEFDAALRFGRLVAGAGLEVANGGYGGIMAAASRGAAEDGGPWSA